jgi:hypothetical protein
MHMSADRQSSLSYQGVALRNNNIATASRVVNADKALLRLPILTTAHVIVAHARCDDLLDNVLSISLLSFADVALPGQWQYDSEDNLGDDRLAIASQSFSVSHRPCGDASAA